MAKTTQAMTHRIRDLQQSARRLEPESEERSALARMALDYAEGFLQSLPTAPAFRAGDGSQPALDSSPISEDGIGMDEALSYLNNHVDRLGINTPSAGHLAYIPGGPLYHSALADFLADVSNRFSGHFFGAPGAVRIENLLLDWLASVVGYPAGASGNLTSGGSMANLIAIVTARESAGLQARDFPRSVVYLTDEAHHSIAKALHIAGLGECVQRAIPTDSGQRMIPAALEAAIQADEQSGLRPWLVVASAGTTNTGAIDPLEAIAAIARRHSLWFHADGAYGAFFMLCEQGKQALRGIAAADSITLDPHKGLFLPYGSGAVLIREASRLFAAFNSDAAYMQDVIPSLDELAPKDLSPELTRPFRGLRLWLPLKLLGTKPFAAALEEKLLLARYFYETARQIPGIEMGPPPDLSIVTFRFLPKSGDANAFNQKLIQSIQQDGRIFLSSTTIENQFLIRLAVLGVRTHLDTIDQAIEILREKSQALMNQEPVKG